MKTRALIYQGTASIPPKVESGVTPFQAWSTAKGRLLTAGSARTAGAAWNRSLRTVSGDFRLSRVPGQSRERLLPLVLKPSNRRNIFMAELGDACE